MALTQEHLTTLPESLSNLKALERLPLCHFKYD